MNSSKKRLQELAGITNEDLGAYPIANFKVYFPLADRVIERDIMTLLSILEDKHGLDAGMELADIIISAAEQWKSGRDSDFM